MELIEYKEIKERKGKTATAEKYKVARKGKSAAEKERNMAVVSVPAAEQFIHE